jgi:hypothetical protein
MPGARYRQKLGQALDDAHERRLDQQNNIQNTLQK